MVSIAGVVSRQAYDMDVKVLCIGPLNNQKKDGTNYPVFYGAGELLIWRDNILNIFLFQLKQYLWKLCKGYTPHYAFLTVCFQILVSM